MRKTLPISMIAFAFFPLDVGDEVSGRLSVDVGDGVIGEDAARLGLVDATFSIEDATGDAARAFRDGVDLPDSNWRA